MLNTTTYTFKQPKSVRFEVWAQMNNLRLVFWNRDKEFKKTGRYIYCHLIDIDGNSLEERSGSMLTSISGDGNTYLQALRDYAKRISGKDMRSGFLSTGVRTYEIPDKLIADSKTLKNCQVSF